MGDRSYEWFGFSNGREYLSSLATTPVLFAKRCFLIRDAKMQEEGRQAAGGDLKKVLNWFHVMMLGTGMIIGAGIFVSTGTAAADFAGPSVIISFLVAAASALLSSLVYAEFSVQYPFAGGAFNYLMVSLGELVAWLIVCTLLLSYVLANAAVARSFTPYLGQLCNQGPNFGIIKAGGLQIDLIAAGLILFLAAILSFSTGGSSWFNAVVTGVQFVVIAVILIAGFTKAKVSNLTTNFLAYGPRGIFQGGSFVFFSFIGFDAVSTLAEEVGNPRFDMPVGIVGCISLVTFIYFLMALCLVMMVPYSAINSATSFAAAFTYVGYDWGQYLVALGALLGISTGVLVGEMGVARILASLSRTHLSPPFLAKINEKYQTPIVSTVVLGVVTAIIGTFTAFDSLVDMVSAGTLLVFAVVALALLWHRYYVPSAGIIKGVVGPAVGCSALVGISTVFGIWFQHFPDRNWELFAFVGAALLVALVMQLTLAQAYVPLAPIPLFPFTPTCSLLLNAFLMSTLPVTAYQQYAIFLAAVTGMYLLYSIHSASVMDKKMLAGKDTTLPPDEEFRVESVLRLGVLVPSHNSLTEKAPEGLRLRSVNSRESGSGLPRLTHIGATGTPLTKGLEDAQPHHEMDTEMASRDSVSFKANLK